MSDLNVNETMESVGTGSIGGITRQPVPERLAGSVQAASYPGNETNPEIQERMVIPSQNESSCPGCREAGRLYVPIGQYIPLSAGVQSVYALGRLGYDLGFPARIENLKLVTQGNPYNPGEILQLLDKQLFQASSITWTLTMNNTPIYAILPMGPFAEKGYEQVRDIFTEQSKDKDENSRVTLPGIIFGKAQLMCGNEVPVVVPDPRGFGTWSLEKIMGQVKSSLPDSQKKDVGDKFTTSFNSFLQKLNNDYRNLGITSKERALNFAITEVVNFASIFANMVQKGYRLKGISVEPSAVYPQGSDCWDTKLTFFDPENNRKANSVYLLTIDVSDTMPVITGPIRHWED
jgi:cyanobactin maturation PatA/PatG family protease